MIINRILNRLRVYYNIYKHKQVKTSYGNDNPDKVFYIIGVDYKTEGLFAIVKNTLVHIQYAVEKGYIPVVDMLHFTSQFSKLTNGNVWEFFFKQPMGYALEDIKTSKNIILSKNITNWGSRSIFPNIVDECNAPRRKYMSDLYKKYIIPNDKSHDYIESKYKTIIGCKDNVLGLLCRGTDYTQKRPKGHPIQPDFEQIVTKVDEVLKLYGCEYIYVATEDKSLIESLKTKYGNMILEIGQKRFGDIKVDFISDLDIKNDELIQLNLDYYASLVLLSRCRHFVGGRTAGTIGVSLMNTNFESFFSWDLGKY